MEEVDPESDLSSASHFAASDYWHLLAATASNDELDEQPQQSAAEDGRTKRASRRRSAQRARSKQRPGEEEEEAALVTVSRTRRRPLRRASVEIEDAEEEPRSWSRRRSLPPAVSNSPRDTSRSPIRSSPSSASNSPIRPSRIQSSPSASDLATSDTNTPAHEDGEDGDDDDVLECGLHRRSFNNGYYSRFFVEERKLGSGGVGGVYLTHHVLDSVRLGTYAVKKIPVGNSRSWLLQVLKEVRALEGLHHRHIVAYKHSWLETFRPTQFGPPVPCLFMLQEVSATAARMHSRASSSLEPPPTDLTRYEIESPSAFSLTHSLLVALLSLRAYLVCEQRHTGQSHLAKGQSSLRRASVWWCGRGSGSHGRVANTALHVE